MPWAYRYEPFGYEANSTQQGISGAVTEKVVESIQEAARILLGSRIWLVIGRVLFDEVVLLEALPHRMADLASQFLDADGREWSACRVGAALFQFNTSALEKFEESLAGSGNSLFCF